VPVIAPFKSSPITDMETEKIRIERFLMIGSISKEGRKIKWRKFSMPIFPLSRSLKINPVEGTTFKAGRTEIGAKAVSDFWIPK